MGQIFDELKRRNVFRVAIAYLVATWLVLQVADLVLENINAPAWVMQVFMLLFALGFPLALIFSWAYELTPEGVKREQDVDRDRSVTRRTGRKLDQVTIGLLLAVVALVVADRSIAPRDVADDLPTIVEEITDKSIAILAFEDLSEAGDQEYFADGLSEELLNVLAQVPDLQVAGRTSSFAFKGKGTDLREIGDILNVAHILEGSVRKAGDRIRVTAQLINAETGFHLFSESYDRDLDDIFAVQDELAAAIGNALQSELIGTTAVAEATPTEVAAYDLYLEARQRIHSRNKDDMLDAVELLDEALAIDPDYVPALTQKALAIHLLSDSSGSYGDIPTAEALAVARPLLERALEIDDRYGEAHAVIGLIMDEEGASYQDQIAALRRAVALNPSLDNARTWLSSALTAVREFDEARLLLEGIVERDPLFGPAFNNLTQSYVRTRDYDDANALIDRVERITGTTDDVNQSRAFVAFSRGDLANAVLLYRPIYESNPSATIVQMFYGFTLANLGEFEALTRFSIPPLRVFGLLGSGEPEAAEKQLQQWSAVARIDDILDVSMFFHSNTGAYDKAIALVSDNFDSLDALLEQHPRTEDLTLGYMPDLAWAYLQLEMPDEFDKVVAAMQHALEVHDAANTVFFPLISSDADLSAVTGDVDGVLAKVQRLVDMNYVSADPFFAPYYEQYLEIEAFRKMNDLIVKRANNERAKLELPPYRRTNITE